MLKKISFFIVLFMSTSLFSQQSKLEKYQYIIVSDQFDFVRSTDQYQTSSLTKFLLKKKGFKVFLSNERFPKELQNNRCTALEAAVKDESGMFTTVSTIQIKDCYGEIVYVSKAGESKAKEYKKAYQEAIRNAFASMTDFKYSYNPSSAVEKEEEKEVILTSNIPVKIVPEVVVISEIKEEVEKVEIIVSNAIDVLSAQSKNNGLHLMNTKLEVVFVILKTNRINVFVIKDKNGIFYKSGENWVSEYYENNQLIQKEFQVKF
tara:strand:+ start:591 stop:1376 length:786 start_codon:yes stop_codon:yes gene_type:complete